MTEARVYVFISPCPKGHERELKFLPSKLKSQLDSGDLHFYCLDCDETRPASEQEKANLRKRIEDGTLPSRVR